MTYTKRVTALACALALPAAVLLSLPGAATAAGASPGPATRYRAAEGPTMVDAEGATMVEAGTRRSGRALAELSPTGTRAAGDLGTRPRGPEGGDPAGPSASGSLSAGPWCIYQCITKGVAYRHGDGVRLVVETSSPADIHLLVCRDDDADNDCDYFGWESSGPGQTEFEWVIDPLAPGTYWVTATATDTTGTSHAFGEFTLT